MENGATLMSQLKELLELQTTGVINQNEFQVLKADLLAGDPIWHAATTTGVIVVATCNGDDGLVRHAAPAEADREQYGEMHAYLADIRLLKYMPTFVAEQVTFDTLLYMVEADLKDLGIAKGPRVKITRTMKTWSESRSEPAVATAPAQSRLMDRSLDDPEPERPLSILTLNVTRCPLYTIF